MDPNSSLGKICLGDDVIVISSDKVEGSGDWNSPKYQDTTVSKGKKVMNALSFYRMETDEISERYIEPCFVNGLEAFDGEIYLAFDENLISNEFAKGKDIRLFLKIILRSAKGIVNFREGTITIQPDFDPFLLSSDEEKNPNLDDLETLLDFDFDEEPQTETDLPPLVCKMGKGSRNKKKVIENIMYFNNGAGPSSSFGTPLTQEEAEKRALAHNIGMRYEIQEEVRPVIETLAYSDKYRKLLDEIWADKVRLDGMIKPEEERVMVKVKGQMLKEKKDPGAFLFPIRLEGRINENALADTGSDTNTMPYRIYEQLGRDDIMKEERNITMINYTEAEVTGRLVNTSGAYDHEARSSRAKRSRNIETVEGALLPDVHHEFLEWRGCSREAKSRYNSRLATLLPKLIYSPQIVDWQLLHKIDCRDEIDQMLKISLKEAQTEEEVYFFVAWVRDFNIREPIYPKLCHEFYATYEFDEEIGIVIMLTKWKKKRTNGYEKIQRNDLWLLSMFEDRHQNGHANVAWVIAKWTKRKGAGSQKDSQICCGQFISKIARKSKVLTKEIIRSLSTPVYCKDLDRTTLRELIDSEDRLILDISVDNDLYERMGSMEIRQEAIERMEYRQSYHWDRYQGVFEHMTGVYNVPLQGAYNPPGYGSSPNKNQYVDQAVLSTTTTTAAT
ncbi:hypothetical protein Tco_0370387 [Tanacetum coccineum]